MELAQHVDVIEPPKLVERGAAFSDRRYLSYGGCLEVREGEDYQNCSVLYCVLKFCTVISALRRAVLTTLWIGFCLTEPMSLCLFICVYVCVYLVILHMCCITVTRWDGYGTGIKI